MADLMTLQQFIDPVTGGIKSGKVLEVISDNYSTFAECKGMLIGYRTFYSEVRQNINKPKE